MYLLTFLDFVQIFHISIKKNFIQNLDLKNENKKKYVRVNFQEEQKTMPIKYTKYFCVKCYYVVDPKISTWILYFQLNFHSILEISKY